MPVPGFSGDCYDRSRSVSVASLCVATGKVLNIMDYVCFFKCK